VPAEEAAVVVDAMQSSRGFAVDLSHLSIGGQCASCAEKSAR
jgi:hypothetical protein